MAESTCAGGCACQPSTMGDDRGSVSRRGVLAGSAATLAALALGACTSSDDSAGTSTPSPGDAASPTSAEPSGEVSPEPSAGSPSTGEALAATDFPVGGGVVVVNSSVGPVVVTQPAEDEYKGFNGRCPHAGCPVAEVLENTIVCNCHGSTFDASSGDRLGGPAPTGLEPVAIQVSDGEIYLA